MSAGLSTETKKLRLPRMPGGVGPAFKTWLLTCIHLLARACNVQIIIDGASAAEGGDGKLAFKINPGSGEVHAWKASAVDSTHISMSGGTITDEVATFTPDLSYIPVSESDHTYVYLHLTIEPTITNGFCSLAGITSAEVRGYTVEKTNSNTHWYILLLEWEAGSVTAQHCYFSLQCEGGYGGDGIASIKSWPIG